MFSNLASPFRLVSIVFLGLFMLSTKVSASQLSSDLSALVIQGQAIDTQLAGVSLTTDNSCSELKLASTSIADWLAAIDSVYNGMTTPLSVDEASLTSLDDLSNLSVTIAGRIYGFSQDLNSIAAVAELIEYDASLAAILRLSDDIGSMANRIGEMADRILVMADNIGLMAARILVTQQLQSANLITTQNSILATQQNAIILSQTISTLVYEPALSSLLLQANALGVSMDLTYLTRLNMSVELARIEAETLAYLNQLIILYTLMTEDSQLASHYINGNTLTLAGDLSTIHTGLASSIEAFSTRVNNLAPFTSTRILSDATDTMLRLVADIGVISDRIVQMVDRIVVMGDNIGEMSVSIVETQNLQQTNIAFTQASLTAATNATVTTIADYGL